MNKVLENNQVTISGEIVSKCSFSHKFEGEKFYTMEVEIPRKSLTVDKLPVMVSERLIDVKQDMRGLKVVVNGQYRSYNRKENNKTHLDVYVFAINVEFVGEALESYENNSVYLEGFVCKEPVYRETPLGREITDVLIAVNRDYGKSDYIPCICFGRTALFVSTLGVGTKCSIKGRIQSRNYTKTFTDGTSENRVAYEVCFNSVEVLENV